MTTDFRQQLNELKNAADKEDYAKQLANIFLTANLDLKTILLMAMDYGAQSRWISVEDEFPKERDWYLIYDASMSHDVCMWYGDCWGNCYNVTHWMPLPPQPSASEKPTNCKKKGGKK